MKRNSRQEQSCAPEETVEKAFVVTRRTHVLAVVAIVILIFAAYSNALFNSFIWDDEFLVRDNAYIRSFSHASDIFKSYLAISSGNRNNFYRPIQELTYMIDYFLWGYVPFGFHLMNVIFHALAAIGVYFLSLRLLKNAAAAFITAALFGIHPINTEAVTYVAGRADPLYLLFFLVSFILFLRSTDGLEEGKKLRLGFYAISVSCYVLSILSKEIGLIVPVFLLAYIATFYGTSGIRNRLYSLCVPYAAVAVLYIVARKTILDFSAVSPSFNMAKFNIIVRLLTTCKAVCVYLGLLVAPFGLHMERKIFVPRSFVEPQLIGALLVIALLFFVIRRWHRTSRTLFFAGVWFFIGLIPVSNIVPINSLIAEHWVYLPAIGIYMIAASGITAFFFGRGARPFAQARALAGCLVVAAVLAFYSVQTFERNKAWKDTITFFVNTIQYSPRNARLHLNFGNAYSELGRDDEALEEYLVVVKLQPQFAEAYSNIGSIHLSRGDYQKAREYIDKALQLKPGLVKAWFMRGILYEGDGDMKKAEEAYLKVIEILPSFVDGYRRLGQLYLKGRQVDKALACWNKIVEVSPTNAEAKELIRKFSN